MPFSEKIVNTSVTSKYCYLRHSKNPLANSVSGPQSVKRADKVRGESSKEIQVLSGVINGFRRKYCAEHLVDELTCGVYPPRIKSRSR